MKIWLKRLLKIVLVLLLLFTCAWWIENWRGARAWEKAQARAEAAGVSLDIADFQQAPIPDEENLLKNPVFLAEWNGEVEPRLDRWSSMNLPGLAEFIRSSLNPKTGETNDYREYLDEEELTEEEAEQRLQDITKETQNRLNQLADIILSYPVHDLGDYAVPTSEEVMPDFGILEIQRLVASFRDQAALSLRLDEPEIALRNITVINRLKATFCQPALISVLVGTSLTRMSEDLIWEGIRLHAWDIQPLEILASLLQKNHARKPMARTVHFELLFQLHSIAHLKDILKQYSESWSALWGTPAEFSFKERFQLYYTTDGPAGWTSQRKAILVNQTINFLDMLESENLSYVEPKVIIAGEEPTNYSPFALTEGFAEALQAFVSVTLKSTTSTRISELGVALEQHFLKNGSYPPSLDELAYDFDITDALDPKKLPLAYQLDEDGRPEIWSLKDPEIRWQFWSKKKR